MKRDGTQRGVIVVLAAVLFGATACSDFETGYFRGRVNQATQEAVAKRYGSPHRIDRLPEGRSAWTYFERGSATTGYAGYAKSGYCRAYVLTFDDQGVLRDWREEHCPA